MHGRRLAVGVVSLFVALVLTLAFIPAPSVLAQGDSPWNKHDINTTPLRDPWGVHVADIDGDGNPDVVATNNSEAAYEVVWYEAPVEPTGSWTKHNIDVE